MAYTILPFREHPPFKVNEIKKINKVNALVGSLKRSSAIKLRERKVLNKEQKVHTQSCLKHGCLVS